MLTQTELGRNQKFSSEWVLSVFAVLILVFFFSLSFFIPLSTLFTRAFGSSQGSLRLLDPSLIKVVKFTVFQALLSTALSLTFGVPIGVWLGRIQSHQSKMSSRLSLKLWQIVYSVPTLIAALSLIQIFGRRGFFFGLTGISPTWLYTTSAVVFAHVLFNVPLVVSVVANAMSECPPEQSAAARVLGARSLVRFWEIERPYLQNALFQVSLQIYSLCIMSFTLVLILGGGPPVETLETQIFTHLRYGTLNVRGAIKVAFWQLCVTLMPWVLLHFSGFWRSSRQLNYRVNYRVKRSERSGGFNRLKELPAHLAEVRFDRKSLVGLLQPSLLILIPLGVLVILTAGLWFPLQPSSWISSWRSLLSDELFQPLVQSFEIALLTAVISLIVILCGAWIAWRYVRLRSLVSFFYSLPAGVSVLVLGLSIWITWGKWIDPFSGSVLLIAVVQSVTVIPLGFRVIYSIASTRQDVLLSAASVLGASRLIAFVAIEWPRWRGPLLRFFLLSISLSLGELAAVSLFYSETLVPLPLWMSRVMGRYRFEDAMVAGQILLVTSFLIQGLASVRLKKVANRELEVQQ